MDSRTLRSYVHLAREQLRNSDIYPYYRRISARRQQAEVEGLIRRLYAIPRDLDIQADLARQLESLRGRRRHIPAEMKQARVVTFGARGWEKYGLWPSFERAFDCHPFYDDVAADLPLFCETAADRRARSERLVQFVARVGKTKPVDIVFLYCDASNLEPASLGLLREMGCWVVAMGLDDRHTFNAFKRGELDVGVESLAPHVDLYWTSWKAGIALHHAIGSRAWLGGLGADPDFYKPVEVPRDIDVLFLGQSYGVRREIVWKLRRLGVKIEARGFGWPEGFVSFEETIRLFSRARVVLGISAVGAMEHVTIMKGRDFEVPMCGACYVTQFVAELGEFFSIGRDIACYSDAVGAAEQIAWLLRDGAAAQRMREAARASAVGNNTWDARVRELYDVLCGQRALDARR